MKPAILFLVALGFTLSAAAALLGVSDNLGVSAIPTDKLKDAPKKSGLLIAAVTPDSPAAQLDLKAGDVIMTLNGKPATADALAAIDKKAADDFSVDAEVWSNGTTRSLSYNIAGGAVSVSSAATAGEAKVEVKNHVKNEVKEKIESKRKQMAKRHAGIQKRLKEERPTAARKEGGDRAYLGVRIRNDQGGVRVAEVVPDSPAAKAGLQSGDLIFSIDGEAIDDVQQLLDAVAASGKGTTIEVGIDRHGESQHVEAKLGKSPANYHTLPPVPNAREWLRQLPMPPALQDIPAPADNADLDAIWEELGRLRGEVERLRRELHR